MNKVGVGVGVDFNSSDGGREELERRRAAWTEWGNKARLKIHHGCWFLGIGVLLTVGLFMSEATRSYRFTPIALIVIGVHQLSDAIRDRGVARQALREIEELTRVPEARVVR